MEFFGIDIEDVALLPHCHKIGTLCLLRSIFALCPVFTGGIIDDHAGLGIVDIDIEADTVACILHRVGLHLYPPAYQFLTGKHRCYPVQHVVLRFLYIVGNHILKGQHTVHITVTGTGDQIAFIGVFTGELEANEMAAVIQALAVHMVILRLDPARRLDLRNALPALGRHNIHTDAGHGIAAAPKTIQRRIMLVGALSHILLSKFRLVVIDDHIGLAGKRRNIVKGSTILRLVILAEKPAHRQHDK